MKDNIRFWKSAKLSECLVFEFKMFQSIIVEEKEEFLK